MTLVDHETGEVMQELVIPDQYTKTSLLLPDDLTYEQWDAVGKQVQKAADASMWWLGDWWAYGERKYGELAAQAADSDYAYETWRAAAWVSQKVESVRRLTDLSWSHHQQVAALDPDAQDQVLTDAVANGWTVRQTRVAARRVKGLGNLNGATGKDHAEWIVTDQPEPVECSALITDPPYGIIDEPWEPEKLEEFTREWLQRWADCGADTIVAFWSQRHLFHGLDWFIQCLPDYTHQQTLIWHYRNNKSPQSRKGFKQTWEPIFFFRHCDSSREIRVGEGEWGDDLHDFDCHVAAVPQSNFNGADQKLHPAQKPVSVMRWLVNAVTNPGEKICDPFCGSGTTGIAATQLGRGFHGIETDQEFSEIARRRIATYGK